MEAYPRPPAQDKSSVTNVTDPSRWPLAARLAMTHGRNHRHHCTARCEEKQRRARERGQLGDKHHAPGSSRRARMEYHLVAGQEWLRHVLRGEAIDGRGGRIDLGRSIQLAELARAHLGRLGPSSARLRQLVQLVMTTGPAAGWAFTDAHTRGPKGPTYVRLYLPRRSEPVARAWLRLLRELRALLWRVGQLASQLIPALRTSSNTARSTTVWRDHQPAAAGLPAWLEAVRSRWCPDTAM